MLGVLFSQLVVFLIPLTLGLARGNNHPCDPSLYPFVGEFSGNTSGGTFSCGATGKNFFDYKCTVDSKPVSKVGYADGRSEMMPVENVCFYALLDDGHYKGCSLPTAERTIWYGDRLPVMGADISRMGERRDLDLFDGILDSSSIAYYCINGPQGVLSCKDDLLTDRGSQRSWKARGQGTCKVDDLCGECAPDPNWLYVDADVSIKNLFGDAFITKPGRSVEGTVITATCGVLSTTEILGGPQGDILSCVTALEVSDPLCTSATKYMMYNLPPSRLTCTDGAWVGDTTPLCEAHCPTVNTTHLRFESEAVVHRGDFLNAVCLTDNKIKTWKCYPGAVDLMDEECGNLPPPVLIV